MTDFFEGSIQTWGLRGTKRALVEPSDTSCVKISSSTVSPMPFFTKNSYDTVRNSLQINQQRYHCQPSVTVKNFQLLHCEHSRSHVHQTSNNQ